MPVRSERHLCRGWIVVLLLLTLGPRPALAHNAFASSDPASGARLGASPTVLRMRFTEAVQLSTVTLELLTADGERVRLGQVRNGDAPTEVVVALPPVRGAATVEWRQVGQDGHVVSGSVVFEVLVATTPSTTTPSTTTPSTTTPSTTTPSTTVPSTTVPPPAATSDPPLTARDVIGSSPHPTVASMLSDTLRWLLRLLAYAAMVLLIGIVAVRDLMWRDAFRFAVVGRAAAIGLATLAAVTTAQFAWLCIDVGSGGGRGAAVAVRTSLSLDAGRALAARLALTALLAVLGGLDPRRPGTRAAGRVLMLALLATWALAGHGASFRWPWLGVLLDVAHFAGAGAWLASLALVAGVALPRLDRNEVASLMWSYSRVAPRLLGLLVISGVLQALRLYGLSPRVLDSRHALLLALKLAALAVMLRFADRNRRRVQRRFHSRPSEDSIHSLRIDMLREAAVGAVVIALTAVLVVTPPPVAPAAAHHAASAHSVRGS